MRYFISFCTVNANFGNGIKRKYDNITPFDTTFKLSIPENIAGVEVKVEAYGREQYPYSSDIVFMDLTKDGRFFFVNLCYCNDVYVYMSMLI